MEHITGEQAEIVLLCAPELEQTGREIIRALGPLRLRITHEPGEVKHPAAAILLISDPSGDPDWWAFHLPALRSTRDLRRYVVCAGDDGGVRRLCRKLGVPETDVPLSGHSAGAADFAAATLYEYLLSTTRREEEPDPGFIDWLLTCAAHAPGCGAISVPGEFVQAARIARVLSSIGPRAAQFSELSRLSDEVKRLRRELTAAEAAEAQLLASRQTAATELGYARLFALALQKLVRGGKPEPRPDTFDEALYLALYPDVATAVNAGQIASGWQHWLEEGQSEGRFCPVVPRDPNVPGYFADAAYLESYPDVADAIKEGSFDSAFGHWVQMGMYEGRKWPVANPVEGGGRKDGFDPELYTFFNPDVSVAIRTGRIDNAWDHWREHGSFEGRAGGVLDVIEPRRTSDIEKRRYGVNLYGFLSAVSGLGSHARGSIRALNGQSIPLQTVDVPSWARAGIERRDTITEPYRINLIHQNADMMVRFLRAYGKELLNGRYNIGYWLWELPSCRMDWYHTFRYVDEVWVASEFCRHAFQTMTRLPVVRIPLVVDGLDEKATLGREHFRFPDDVFVFCYIYDISSQLERKNPECVIEAFRQEFGASKDVLLFLKSSNSSHDRVQAARLARMAEGPNIRIWDGLMTEDEIVSLHQAIDCFVSPHRAEGFGFNLAEAMYFAKPVIATAYSSNVDFMTQENSYLLDYRLVPVRESAGPYLKGFVWADPLVEHLRQLMRRVFDKRDERETKGRKASQEIRKNYSAEAVGRMMRGRFQELGLDRELIPEGIVVPHMTRAEWPRFSRAGVPRTARTEIGGWDWKPVISILTPVYNVPGEYLRKCIKSVQAQWYPHWELCLCDDASTRPDTMAVLEQFHGSDPRIKLIRSEQNLGIAGASNRAAEISSGEYIALLDNDDEIAPDALYEVVKALQAEPSIDFLYTDEDKIEADGSFTDHYYKPDWSPEHLRSVMYLLHMLVFDKQLFYDAGGFRPEYSGAQDYDLALRMTARARHIHHIPKVLYHWRKIEGSAAAKVDAKPEALTAGQRALADFVQSAGIDAEVGPGLFTGSFRVKHRIQGDPRVTLCILTPDRTADVPGRGRINFVSNFVHSIARKTEYRNYEIMIVADGDLSAQTKAALAGIEYRVLKYAKPAGPFNFSKKVNFAFSGVRTEHLVLLNDDLEVIAPGWLSALLEFTQQKEIGCAGGRLLFPDGRVQHVGMVLGVNRSASHVYHAYPADRIGYNGFTHLIRNYSAVTAACLATRRSVVAEAGGFDETFATDFNDVDFCLSVRRRGYRVVYTPYCELLHFENVSFRRHSQNPKETRRFIERWKVEIDRDPYYNVNLSRTASDFSVLELPSR